MDITKSDLLFSCEWSSLERKLHKLIFSLRPAALASLMKKLIGTKRGWMVCDGIKFQIDPISHFGQELINTGTYEPVFSKQIISFLGPGYSFLDIGANEGFFSLLAARAVGPTGKVFSVEPQPELVKIIQKNSRENGFEQIQIFPEAFGEIDGEVDLNLSFSLNSGSSSLFGRHLNGPGIIKVKSQRFDQWWIHRGRPHFQVVKVDCEGAELFVIRSAKEALKEQFADLIFVDFHESIIGFSGVAEIDSALREAGYQLSELQSGVWCYHLPTVQESVLKEQIRRHVPALTHPANN